MSFGDHADPPLLRQPSSDVGKGPRDVTAVRLGRAGVDGVHVSGVIAGRLLVGGERRQRPPRQTDLPGFVPDVAEGAVRRRTQIQRCRAACRSGRPGRLQELLARPHELMGAGTYTFRVADEDVPAGREDVDQQLHVVGQHRRERLHAFHRDAVGDALEDVGHAGPCLDERLGAGAHIGGQQQLPTRRSPESLRGGSQTALVRHGELPDLLDRVPPQLEADGVFLVRREHVEDAAPHGELTTSLDELHPGEGDLDEPGDRVVEHQLVTDTHRQRLDVAQATHLWLQR